MSCLGVVLKYLYFSSKNKFMEKNSRNLFISVELPRNDYYMYMFNELKCLAILKIF